MRTIEYRGKDMSSKEWIYGFYVEGALIDPYTGKEKKRFIIHGKDGFLHDIDPNTLGEFTGMTDKNGKKIYEGDIVNEIRNVFSPFFVSYRAPKYVLIDCDNREWLMFSSHIFKVIGNIHDNPELMKGGIK